MRDALLRFTHVRALNVIIKMDTGIPDHYDESVRIDINYAYGIDLLHPEILTKLSPGKFLLTFVNN